MQFIDLQAQYQAYKSEIDTAIAEVLQTSRYINGPNVENLEKGLAHFVGVERGVGFSSGTDALLATLMAWNIGPGDEVITTPFTFIATAEVICLVGAKPVFVDIEPDTLNMDPACIEAAITEKTKLIMPVSLYGQCADFDAINAIAKKHGLLCFEDACQSMGAEQNGKRSCSLTQAGAVSFFPAKPMGCYGDGGMVFTDDSALADTLLEIREHGQSARYQHGRIGINGRLDAIQAAILLVKAAHFEDEIEARQKVAQRYMDGLKGVVDLPVIRPGNKSVFAQFTIRSPERVQLAEALGKAGIPTAVHYPIPLHRQPVFADLGYSEDALPVADKAASQVLSLPMHPFMQQSEQDQVIQAIKSAT
ncbi:MAG: DegT/DnrJ/EryC1/StrS family aminotransferase [Magnetococcales bacterium]|nr:DegT/DnrJ/EryC1/StrS family aminotransferase [Magnetococcales bacterium]